MIRQIQIYIILIISFAVIGCSHTTDKLNAAGQLMETKPDSALHMLRKLKNSGINGSYNKALYALLMSQALDKNDIKVESDSLISIATDYFDDSDPVHAGYAWFYHARTSANRDSVREQANNLLKAEDYAESAIDYKLLGLIYSDKASMYKNQLQCDSSVFYFNKAYSAFNQVSDHWNTIITLINLGDEYLYKENYDSTFKYYKIAEASSRILNNTLLSSTMYRNFGGLYYVQNDFREALKYYQKAPLTNIKIYDSNKYYLIAKTYIQLAKLDSAEVYLDKVRELKSMAPDYYKLRQIIAEKKGDKTKALFYAGLVNTATDSIYKHKLDVSLAGFQLRYKFQNGQITIQRLTIKNKQKELYLTLTLLIIALIIGFLLFWRLQVKRREADYQKDIADKKQELIEKKDILLRQEQETLAKERENNLLLDKQLKLQDILLSNIKMHQTNSIKRPNIWKEGSDETILKQLDTFSNELKTYVDMKFDNFSIRIKEKHPVLTENDIIISCLLISDFDTGMIATILNVQADSMNKQRYRLRTKLNLLKSDNLLDYLLHF